jgi:hypothetical protein
MSDEDLDEVGPNPGPNPTGPTGARELPDDGFKRVLRELRADPTAFVVLAVMPVADAVAAAADLWGHGIDAAFVPRDDPIAPPEPEFDPEAADEPWDDEGADGAEGDQEVGGGETEGEREGGTDAEDADVPASLDDGMTAPPPGLERSRPSTWIRPNQPLPASVVLVVRTGDEARARSVAARHIGVL